MVAEERMRKAEEVKTQGQDIEWLTKKVAKEFGITVEDIRSRSRTGKNSKARAVISYIGTQQLYISGIEIARYLGLSRPTVSYLIERGRAYLEEEKSFRIF